MSETLYIPDAPIEIKSGDIVRIGRYSSDKFIVGYGWYSYGGNRPFCGWYLTNQLTKQIKPLLYTDIEDIYCISSNESET